MMLIECKPDALEPARPADPADLFPEAKRRERRRRVLYALAATLALASVTIVGAALTGGFGSAKLTGTPTPGGSASRPIVVAHPSLLSATSSSVAFAPVAVSFTDPSHGWVLGQSGCPTCFSLRVTRNGGRSWATLRAPSGVLDNEPGLVTTNGNDSQEMVSQVLFVSPSTGFLFGPDLEVTRDGGHSWRDGGLSNVTQLLAAGNYLYALASPNGLTQLWRSPKNVNHWTALSVPTEDSELAGQLSVAGAEVLYLTGGNLGRTAGSLYVSTDAGTSFSRQAVPCASGSELARLVAIAQQPVDWVVDCMKAGLRVSQTPFSSIYRTDDGGSNWTLIGSPSKDAALSNLGFPRAMAANGRGGVLIAGTHGPAGDALVTTTNWGATWSTAVTDGGNGDSWAGLGFVSPSTALVVGPTYGSPEHLYASADGGANWRALLSVPT